MDILFDAVGGQHSLWGWFGGPCHFHRMIPSNCTFGMCPLSVSLFRALGACIKLGQYSLSFGVYLGKNCATGIPMLQKLLPRK